MILFMILLSLLTEKLVHKEMKFSPLCPQTARIKRVSRMKEN